MEVKETTKCSEKLSSPSCLSMKSKVSMDTRYDFDKEPPESISVHLEDLNMASLPDQAIARDLSTTAQHDIILRYSDRDQQDSPEAIMKDDINTAFTLMESRGIDIFKSEVRRYKKILVPNVSQLSENENHEEDSLMTDDIKPDHSASEGVLKIAMHVFNEMGRKELAKNLEKCVYGELEVCQRKLRHKLKRFEYIYEGVAQHGNQTLLNKVYTELYVTEGVSGSVNSEHEIRQIQAANRRPETEDRPIKCEDIFKPFGGQERFIRTVLTKGIAGIGKTISVQKFNLEWAEKRIYQDIHLFINLPFRELNLMKRCFSLTQLLNHFLEETNESGISDFGEYKLVLIFDGLDECRLPLDFDHNEPCLCVSESVSVDVLLTNVLKGNLLPSAHIWITSRPAAANRIPAHLVDRLTEIRGFTNPQKEEYFRKKISNQDMASRVISHVKSSRSLHIMCHIPVFSWISATVLQRILEEDNKEIPNTLTQMYTHYLHYSSLTKCQKYPAGLETEAQFRVDEQMILKLGKLAFEHLMKSNIIFYESELKEYDIDIDNAAVCSGMFTQISKTDFGFHHERVYCFVHLSIQEYFAALYVFHTFVCFSHNVLEPQEHQVPGQVTGLLKSAVDKALKSENGNLDLFLRFLLGLSQKCNQTVLKSVLPTLGGNPPVNKPVIEYIKEQISKNLSPERCTNLFFCLMELEDQSLVEEIQTCLSSGSLSEIVLSPSQWSALTFVLLTSKEKLDDFDLRKYSRSVEGLLWLLPVMKESQVALLKECNLTEKCCKALAEALSSSCVKELDLSDNDLRDEGVKLLSAGLARQTCQLKTLRLMFCGITNVGCGYLAKALWSNPTHLKELDLRYNHPGKQGIGQLSSVQEGNENLTVWMENNGECYLKSALKKYAHELTLDLNTAHSQLAFSDGNLKITRMEAAHPYPDSPERFTDWGQVLCQQGLRERCYWEVEWTGEWIGVGVAYKGISREATGNECVLGYNEQSWSLRYCHGKYTAWYNKSDSSVPVPYFSSRRVGVFLDWSAGTLSYAISPHAMTHLHTFHAEFSEPLYAGLRLGYAGSTLTLCKPQHL